MTELPPLQDDVLPSGIRSRFVRDINGLRVHVLEAGFETRGRPLVPRSMPIADHTSEYRFNGRYTTMTGAVSFMPISSRRARPTPDVSSRRPY